MVSMPNMVDTLDWKERARRQAAGAVVSSQSQGRRGDTHLAERHQPQQDRMKTKYFGKGEIRVRCVSHQAGRVRHDTHKQSEPASRRGVRRRHSRVSLHVRCCIGCA